MIFDQNSVLFSEALDQSTSIHNFYATAQGIKRSQCWKQNKLTDTDTVLATCNWQQFWKSTSICFVSHDHWPQYEILMCLIINLCGLGLVYVSLCLNSFGVLLSNYSNLTSFHKFDYGSLKLILFFCKFMHSTSKKPSHSTLKNIYFLIDFFHKLSDVLFLGLNLQICMIKFSLQSLNSLFKFLQLDFLLLTIPCSWILGFLFLYLFLPLFLTIRDIILWSLHKGFIPKFKKIISYQIVVIVAIIWLDERTVWIGSI